MDHQSSLAAYFVEGPQRRHLRECRQADHGAVTMLDISQPAGDMSASPLAELVISPSLGRPFPFCCDFGAGAFRGNALPMDFAVIPPGADIAATMGAPSTLRFLGIPPATARQHLELDAGEPIDLGGLHARLHRDPLITHGLELLWQELARGDHTSRLFIDTMVCTLLTRLARLASDHRGGASRPRGGMAQHASRRVIEYMQAHLAGPVSLHELAEVAGLSPYHFARAFRETHGMPPHRYLVHMRLEQAREMLSRTGLSVTEIAAACGYSPQHLVRCFRRYTGMTPSAYRHTVRRSH
ncbi:AraC family transcriptional regulator [Aquisalimonas lutea]|uniref:AraC family transcriptional regulator n=1 Tax=Aquisalimonas lutea TaxID=1327750 RepID=UPI0025B340E1|nr:AraC family transcriptional regulator [Aquisalimonas lutea]MDN3519414.1 AraC family transcriptional regulator [Aquisalimonas lutea]